MTLRVATLVAVTFSLSFVRQLHLARLDAWTFPLDPRSRSLKLIASTTYMAQSDFGHLAPRPGIRAPRNDTETAPKSLADGLRRAEKPVVAYVEMRYLPQVFELLRSSPATAPFVLVTSGSDAPMTHQLQQRLLKLPGLRACYSTNLHEPPEDLKEMFFPLPVGFLPGRLNMHNEALLAHARAAAKQTSREGRLLVPWMRNWRLRKSYRSILESEAFHSLVHVMTERLPFRDYLTQLGRHRYVLSPPGKGYDCTRTWEALAMGSMPLILKDETFDMRLYQQASVGSLPPPEKLTPDILSEVLNSVPVEHDPELLQVHHWTALWRRHLQ